MTDRQIRAPDEAPASESDALSRQDATRCKKVEDALYRRACGYKVRLKKSLKLIK